MVTSLKKSKKIRAFCYRMIAMAALVTAICTAVMGREALVDAYYHGMNVFSGQITDLPEFREYMSELYNKAMIGYAGVGDDNGYPLTAGYARDVAKEAQQEFKEEVGKLGKDVLYYVSVPNTKIITPTTIWHAITNVTYPIFSEYDGHLLLPENMLLCCYWDGENEKLQLFDRTSNSVNAQKLIDRYYDAQYNPNRDAAKEIKLVLAVSKDCTVYELQWMEYKAARYQEILMTLLVSASVWFVFGLLSIFTGKAAKKAKEEYGEWSGNVLLEIKLILVALSVTAIAYFGLYTFVYPADTRMLTYDDLWWYFPLGCMVYLLYQDIKHNGGKVFANCLPVKGISSAAGMVRRRSWYRRTGVMYIIMLIGGVLQVIGGIYLLILKSDAPIYIHKKYGDGMNAGGIILLIMGILLILVFVGQTKLLRDMVAIVSKISEVTNGKTGIPLKLSKHSKLAAAANDLNKLEDGIEKAVEEQNRSNRMRVELLTNVSHDLKTPLTSIINYADLLCEEELPETAAEYATALQGKAYRLKNMVQDVFDLSKATSGNLTVENTIIDLAKLIKQTLADMDERIQESNLTFKLNIATEPLMIEADGEKLYRVFQNLFVNALQYSLDNSRVHIQLTEEKGYAVARVKNTSRMELDFEPDEIVERFVRADASRTTEGSGLGLSIVQSFAEACGGEFKIETDADMFTAYVSFPLAPEPVVAAEPVQEDEKEL